MSKLFIALFALFAAFFPGAVLDGHPFWVSREG